MASMSMILGLVGAICCAVRSALLREQLPNEGCPSGLTPASKDAQTASIA
jgi:hypothetical protein